MTLQESVAAAETVAEQCDLARKRAQDTMVSALLGLERVITAYASNAFE